MKTGEWARIQIGSRLVESAAKTAIKRPDLAFWGGLRLESRDDSFHAPLVL